MIRPSNYRVLFAGVLSPFAALISYSLVYVILTRPSSDLEKDWLFRLSLSTLAMLVPFLITLALAIQDGRKHALPISARVGLAVAALSLGLTWNPISDGINRWKQSRHMAMRDVAAPLFDTSDIFGKAYRLAEHRGDVVLVNIWATWCGPCRAEMPKLDHLYHERKDEGFTVFGMSNEDVGRQKEFLQQFQVSYPLLTLTGEFPTFYRDIARYPATFLIDRQGRLQPAPDPDQPFEKLEAAVDALLLDSRR